MAGHEATTVLILEDDPGVARLQKLRLERAGFTVEAVISPDAAMARIRQGGIDLLVLDNQLCVPEDGLGFYRRLKAAGRDLPVVLVTGYSDDAIIVQALRAGVRDYVFKSVEYLNYLPEAVSRVITQERTKERLAGSEALLKAVLNSARDPIITMDDQSRVSLINPAAERMFGCSGDVAKELTIDRFLPAIVPGLAPWTNDLFPEPTELVGRRADGSVLPLEVTCSRVNVPNQALYILILRDITERRHAEAELRESESRFRTLADSAPVLIWLNGPEGNEFVNKSFLDYTGLTPQEVRGMGWASCLHPSDGPAYLASYRLALTERAQFQAAFQFRGRDGEYRWFKSIGLPRFAADGTFLGYVGCSVDITDIREAEREREHAMNELQARTDELRLATQQLWKAARLAGVGELAASIAHELNNPLATVHLRLEDLLLETPKQDPRHRSLEIVDQEVERMARLVANLLQFSRAGKEQVSTVCVSDEVRKAIELTEPHLRRLGVQIQPEFHSVPDIFADRQQLRQVLLNLFTNAADAMPRGGQLIPRVRPGNLPERNPAVVIEVADTGTGIPADVLAHVFDPFFTTKEDGKGTGLGLAICRRIVDQHRGRLEIESQIGSGTTVRVILPIVNDSNVNGLNAE